MTLGSLMNWGGFGNTPAMSPIERYHSGSGGYWEHKSHGHGHKSGGKGGGNGAALSALSLLAFLFLLHVMQLALQADNMMVPAAAAQPALLKREGLQQGLLNAGEEVDARATNSGNLRSSVSSNGAKISSKKGDRL